MDAALGELWRRFDQSLFELKLREPARRMQTESLSRSRRIQFERRKSGQGDGVGSFVAIADSYLEVLREFLEGVDRICREVWTTQGHPITADFVRVVLVQTILNRIEARVGTIKSRIELEAQRKHSTDSTAALRHLAQAVGQLKAKVSERYEIEARELEYQKAPSHQGGPQSQFDELGGIHALELDVFTHSDDYRSVTVRGQNFTLTSRQAQVIQILDENRRSGHPEVGKDYLLEELGTKNSRLRDSFKSNLPAWKELVKTGAKRGTVRLNV